MSGEGATSPELSAERFGLFTPEDATQTLIFSFTHSLF
jgi:hypothetical protein